MASPGQIIAVLRGAYRREEVLDSTIRLYLRLLADIPPPLLEQAVSDVICTHRYFPAVSDIRAAAAERHLALPADLAALQQIEARMTWARTDEETRGDPPAVHPFVRNVLERVGGYHAFRATDNAAVIRGQFLKLYREARAGAVHEAALPSSGLQLPAPDERNPQ